MIGGFIRILKQGNILARLMFCSFIKCGKIKCIRGSTGAMFQLNELDPNLEFKHNTRAELPIDLFV
jgi:hypothetical protein